MKFFSGLAETFRNMKLKHKFIFFFFFLFGGVLLFSAIFYPLYQKSIMSRYLKDKIETVADIGAQNAAAGLLFEDVNAVKEAVATLKSMHDLDFVVVLNENNKEFYRLIQGDGTSISKIIYQFADSSRTSTLELEDQFVSCAMIQSEHQTIGKILVAASLDGLYSDLASSLFLTITISLVILVGGIFSFLQLINYIVSPLQKLSAAAREIGEGHIALNLESNSQDELGELAASFNKMIESLSRKTADAENIARGKTDFAIFVASKNDVLGLAMENMKNSLQKKTDAARAIAAGNLDTDVKIASDEDILGIAMNAMVKNLRKSTDDTQNALRQVEGNLGMAHKVVEEVNRMARLLEEGKLDERAFVTDAGGGFGQLITSINSAVTNILKPVKEIAQCINEMAEGNLAVRVEGDYKGDHALLKNAMNSMLERINSTLSGINNTVEIVTVNAAQVSDASNMLSTGATQQAQSLQEITSSMQQIENQTLNNSENADKANNFARAVSKKADEGNTYMTNLKTAISDINTSSSKVAKIIKTIDEIAFQTNLLALNAAVEAARAGIHGKGFAVVAEEVRNLAQRSARAAQETTEIIEESLNNVRRGTTVTEHTARALAEINSQIGEVVGLINEIAIASKEQNSGISQITTGLGQIDSVTQSNTENARRTASAAKELSSKAIHVKKLVSQFSISENPLPAGAQEPSPHDGYSRYPEKREESPVPVEDFDFGSF